MARRQRGDARNMDAPPVPADEDLIRAVTEICARHRERQHWRHVGASANEVARHLGVRGLKRGGNGAVKGSWSGSMSPSLRVSPALLRLARAGRLVGSQPLGEYRWIFEPVGWEW